MGLPSTTVKKRITTASGKAKGRKLQQYVRDKLLELLGPWGALPDDCKSTSMGAGGEDVQLSPFARKLLPISVECKSANRIALYGWYDQAKGNSKDYEPLLVIKMDRRKPLAVVDLDYYLQLEDRRFCSKMLIVVKHSVKV